MKPSISRILLPVTLDDGFEHAAGVALKLAKQNEATITLAVIDDDSQVHEVVPLPFHEKNFVHTIAHSEEIPNGAINSRAAQFLTRAVAEKVEATEVLAVGHAATQLLLISRFHDLLVVSRKAQFAIRDETGERRLDPLLEVLDQTVIPVLTCGLDSPNTFESSAVFFDGGPRATAALHSHAELMAPLFDNPVYIRVAFIEESIAQKLAAEATRFIHSKGFKKVVTEYSALKPLEAISAGDYTPADVIAMGIRSRTMFHDLQIGVLAEHYLESESGANCIFC